MLIDNNKQDNRASIQEEQPKIEPDIILQGGNFDVFEHVGVGKAIVEFLEEEANFDHCESLEVVDSHDELGQQVHELEQMLKHQEEPNEPDLQDYN